ncbi:MAG TPA: hypothetical protein VKY56_06950 [Chloroflexota bacterium]|nr:hypothetical protein [Chloroflexota bacterium]
MVSDLVGVRYSRGSPLTLAWCPQASQAEPGAFVLVADRGSVAIARIALLPDQILAAPPHITARVIALGTASPEVVAALGRRNAEALETVRRVCGPDVPIRDAAWAPDAARLTLTLAGAPPPGISDLRDRLAARFRVEIRFDWPGGADSPLPG